VGSSNFTLSGSDPHYGTHRSCSRRRNHAKLTEWFEALWNESRTLIRCFCMNLQLRGPRFLSRLMIFI
jgi:hypothetical protein